jgi:YdjC-like protein
MAKMPATAIAIDYAKSHPQFSFGVHLTYTRDGPETPMSDPKDIPDLAPNGRFMEALQVRVRAIMNKIPIDQIERETITQITFLRDQGVKIPRRFPLPRPQVRSVHTRSAQRAAGAFTKQGTRARYAVNGSPPELL